MHAAKQLALTLLAALAVARACHAQNTQPAPASPAPCTVAPQPAPCAATPAKKPSAAEQFPFPGDTGATPPAATPPDAPGTAGGPKSTADKFPFPGEEKPSDPSNPDPSSPSNPDQLQPNSSSPADSSSSSDSPPPADADPDSKSDAPPGLKDAGSEGVRTGRRVLSRVNPIGTKLQTDDEREAEDLNVAHFYVQSGNLQGALLRTEDAVKTIPGDPDAHFALAEIARKLNKRDQAIAEYTACLKLDPQGDHAAAARKALARLKP